MKVVKFFMKVFSYLFVLIFAVLCLTMTVFLMAKNMTSYDNIKYYVKNVNMFDYSSKEVTNTSDQTLRKTIEEELLKMDIPVLVTDEVLDSDGVNDAVSGYIYDYSQYLLFSESKPVFPKDSIIDVVGNVYKEKEGKELSQSQISYVDEYITSLGDKIDKTIFDTSEVNEIVSLNIVKQVVYVLSAENLVIALAMVIVLVFAIICICLNSIKRAVNWCGKAIAFDGVVFVILSFVEVRLLIMYFNSQGLVDNFAILVIEQGFKNMLIYGGVLIAIGILLLITSSVLLRKAKVKEEKEAFNNKQEEKKSAKDKIKEKSKLKEQELNDKQEEKEKTKETKTIEKEEVKKEEEVPIEEPKQEEKTDKKEEEKIETDLVLKSDELPVVSKDNIIEKMELEEVPEEKPSKDDFEEKELDYKEISDEPEQVEIVKEDIKVEPIKEVKVDVVEIHKGKDIEVTNNSLDEDEIEIL